MAALYGFVCLMPRRLAFFKQPGQWHLTRGPIWACIVFADKGLWAVFTNPGKLGKMPAWARPDYDHALCRELQKHPLTL